MESLWMMGGRKDVKWISQFNKSFGQFSDDKKNFHAAYGDRWINHFSMNQIQTVVDILKKNPIDRRAVITMWDPDADLGREGLDFPCNTQIYFDATHGQLNMTVCCRSNDIVWGAYGANAVHMSVLQEIMATMIGIPVGIYWQLSNNWHAYAKTLEPVIGLAHETMNICPYEKGEVSPYPIMSVEPQVWFEDLDVFLQDGPIVGFRDPFFRRVVTPIYQAWKAKENTDDEYRWDKAIEIMQQCVASDWKKACIEWLDRNRK
jgi:thymidylate synthase